MLAAAFCAVGTSARAADKSDGAPLVVYTDLDLAATRGPVSWLNGGTGKGRFDGDKTGLRIRPFASEAGLVLQPHLTWSLGGLVSVIAQHGQDKPVDLSEAYLRYRPLPLAGMHVALRAGLFWPPVSLEHGGGEWPVTETLTPSAINSWIGEEVKVAGIEATATRSFGAHRVAVTIAAFGANDTAGTLLTFRGWALHDEKATAFSLQPLPTLNAFMQGRQATRTRPLAELDDRAGWYGKLAWVPPGPFEIQYVHYDNRGDPEAVDAGLQWGWRTRFDHLGAILDLGARTRLTAQAIRGTTIMGFPKNGIRWVDMRYRSAFLLATRQLTFADLAGSVSARVETFDTRNRGSTVQSADDETGWAVTAATRWPLFSHATLLAEALHIDSRREARLRDAIDPRKHETIVRVSLRLRAGAG